MFAFAISQSAPNISNQVRPSLRSSAPAAVAFRLSGPTRARPRGMYIDMNAGKGCSSCGKG